MKNYKGIIAINDHLIYQAIEAAFPEYLIVVTNTKSAIEFYKIPNEQTQFMTTTPNVGDNIQLF